MELINIFKNQILSLINYMIPIIVISFMSFGIVSIFGRLLEVVKTDHAKNTLAFISILVLAFLSQRQIHNISFDVMWDTLKLATLSVIFYISVCWRFYSRLDTFFDKNIGKDKFKPVKKRKNK